MIRIVAYGMPEEMTILRNIMTELSIQHENLDYSLDTYVSMEEWHHGMEKRDLLDLIICDVSGDNAVRMLIELRKSFKEIRIIPIADEHIRPSVYVRPDISPCTLLWRPVESEENKNSLLQILQLFGDVREKDQVFCITTKQKTQSIPYDKIYYFEARDKKIYVRTEHQEIAFAGTLSQLESRLEDSFIRCHKGYLVNRSKIWAIDWSHHLIQLGPSIFLPVSRNCQNMLREAYHAAG